METPLIRVFRRHNGWAFRVYVGKKRVMRMLKAKSLEEAEEEAKVLSSNDAILSTIIPASRPADPSEIHRVWKKSKDAAAKRGLEFEFPLEEARKLYALQEARCAFTGILFNKTFRVAGSTRRPYKASLDRIDSSKGYVAGNVRWVCVAVNMALGDWGDDVLSTIAFAVHSKRNPRRKMA